MDRLLQTIERYKKLEIEKQIDYQKIYLYSIITHSTAIEGSTVTEIENQLLFDEGITASKRSLQEQMMNLDLKNAYDKTQQLAAQHIDYSSQMLCELSAIVMKNTGCTYNTPLGTFDASRGDLRLLNVTAGFGGRSYLSYNKVPTALHDFCQWLNKARTKLQPNNIIAAYRLSFAAHYRLVTIHPWADGNGRMARLVMNMLQFERGLIASKVLKEQKAEYIDALNQARNANNESIFEDAMLRMHRQNLEAEIATYVGSLSEPLGQDDGQNVPKDVPKQLSERQVFLLDLIRADAGITIAAMSQKAAVTERTIKRDLKHLQALGLLQRVGTRKDGQWRVLCGNDGL